MMEDSTSLVERNRNKFYETKSIIDSKLGDHLVRSRSLLSDVNNILLKSIREDSGYSQRYFADSFNPFKENYSSCHFKCDNSDSFRCSTRMTTSSLLPKNNSALGFNETPRHMTQAMWLLNTSNVSCKLSTDNDQDDQEKIPDILLKDPSNLIKGNDKGCELNKGDNTSELLKESDQNGSESRIFDSDLTNSISYDIVSSLGFYKKTVDNKSYYGTNDFLNKLLNESHDFDDLSQVLDTKENNLNNRTDHSHSSDGLNNIDLITQEFVNNSGLDLKKQSQVLTETLFKLSEKDKLNEIKLPPDMFVNEEKQTKPSKEKEGDDEFNFTPIQNKDLTIGLESDLLGNLTIIKDSKTGRKIHKLSEFDQKFKPISKGNKSVQVQTDFPESEPEQFVEKKKVNTNVKVVYQNGFEPKGVTENKNTSLKREELYAQKLVCNLKPRLEMRFPSYNMESDSLDRKLDGDQVDNEVLDKVKQYDKEFEMKEKEKMAIWRMQRKPIYDKLYLNMKSGVKNSRMCRGGKRHSSVLHNQKRRNELNEGDEMYYISPSNRNLMENENFYGYEVGDEDFEVKKQDRTISGTRYYEKVENNSQLNPIDNFEDWWRSNTSELNMVREQLSI